MKIALLRVDDRYVHGQVTAAWVRIANANEIWVVNDSVAKNPVIKQLQKSLAPPGTNVEVYTIDEAINRIKEEQGKSDNKRVLILVANCVDALKLVEGGAKVESINLGQMAFRQGRKQIAKTASVSPDDVEAIKKLVDMGINVWYQQLPDFPSRPQDVMKLLKDKKLI